MLGLIPRLCSPGLALFSLGLVLAPAVPTFADSVSVNYTVTNVSGSEWKYTYTLSGSVSSGDLLAIYFPASTSANIAATTVNTSGLATSVLQPDSMLPADGEFDLLASSDLSSFSDAYAVAFNYSGSDTPGKQTFTLYDSSFATVQSDVTATPEPGSLSLFGLGLAALLFGMLGVKTGKPKSGQTVITAVLLGALFAPMCLHAQIGPPTGGAPPTGGTPPTSGTPPTGGGGTPPSGGAGPGGGGGTTAALSNLTIGPYKLLNSYRSSAYEYYYTFTTSVSNGNASPYTYVLGTLTSTNPHTTVISGSVEFGLLAANGSTDGYSPFTILQDRRYNFDPSSLTWTFTGQTSTSTVGVTPTTTTVSPSTTGTSYGSTVTLLATVSPAAATGTVTFYDGPTPIGTGTLASGQATLANAYLPVGSHPISASYGGDTTYAASSTSPDAIAIGSGGNAANCSGLAETAQVVCLATAFKATLTAAQLTSVQYEYTLANAGVWTNLPANTRNGLQFSTLSSVQLAAALQLIEAGTSAAGFERFQDIRGADNVLGSYTAGYGSGNYFIAFIGTPSLSSPWQLQVGGHHYAFNHTFNGTYTSGTPYFIGNEPALYTVAGTQYLPMQAPRDAAYALTRSVYGNTNALLSGSFDDVLMGSSGQDSYPKTYPTSGRGIPFSALTAAQQAQVKTMIEAWVKDMDSTTATDLLNAYESADSLAATYVGYSGTGTLATQGDYIRVDGPRVWIEFVVQSGIVFGESYHFHTIWRDKTADYGGDFLSE